MRTHEGPRGAEDYEDADDGQSGDEPGRFAGFGVLRRPGCGRGFGVPVFRDRVGYGLYVLRGLDGQRERGGFLRRLRLV